MLEPRPPYGDLASLLLAVPHRPMASDRRIARGETVFRQGDAAAAVYVLQRGRVRLTRTLADGSSVTLHVAEAGESIAEASLWSPRYHCDAVAEADSVVLLVPKTDLLATLATDPERSMAFARAMAEQVRDLRARLELRNIRSAPDRLLAWLRLHAKGKPLVVALTRPWTLIAEELGLTREAVYRALALLERQGRIARKKDGVELPTGYRGSDVFPIRN
jgi:CRP-like cAMP-binding protein